MSQDNNQNDRQNRQGQGDNWQGESQGRNETDGMAQNERDQNSDERSLESRSSGYSHSPSQRGTGSSGNPSSPELGDTDEMDEDDDRDDDDRLDGSPNRRNNIG